MHKDSVTIEWNKPKDCGGLELIGYFVEKCDVSKMVWTKVGDVEKDSTHLTIRRLQEDSQYMFRVFAQNSVGISEALESETVTIKSTIEPPNPFPVLPQSV
ncbi:hypothetical protein LSTR_LSTR016039 [Laodelphax striatellus]|uniref:Fibronectin type-III domain-containing protein n=1 Tax=Laodelphax striatellus TaxID=195883 RepID=A0A482XES6_LAOST|nr:hypothetical protein LSTR_LSTR016039 [Laodelphax striatellus]